MQDDFITSLTYEIREEILEKYFYERRLIELQIPRVHELAQHAQKLEHKLRVCFARLDELLIDNHYVRQFAEIIGHKSHLLKKQKDFGTPNRKVPIIIKLGGITSKGKFKKLLFEEYQKLCGLIEAYRESYENLREECNAVNYNMEKFEKNYDLMIIINFLKSMDTELVMKKYFMGSNFTPEEIGAVGEGLAFKKILFEQFQLTEPPEVPDLKTIHNLLTVLANKIYAGHTNQIKTLLRQR